MRSQYPRNKRTALISLVAAVLSVVAVIPASATGDGCDSISSDLSPVPLTPVPGADALSADCVPAEQVTDLTVTEEGSSGGFAALSTCNKTLSVDPSTLFGGGFQEREFGDETDVHDGWDGNNARLYIQVNRPVSGFTQVYQLRGRGRAVNIQNLSNEAMTFNVSIPWAFKARTETTAGLHGGFFGAIGGSEADSSVDWRVDFEEDGPSGLFEINQRNGHTASHTSVVLPADADWNDHDTSGTVSRVGYGVPANGTRDYVWNIHMEADVIVDAFGAGLGSAEYDAKNGDKRLAVSPITLTITSNHCWA